MLMDFIFGKPAESNLNERSQALNDLLLDELMKLYQQGPNPLPTYTAMAPELAYSAPNTLLASLGLESVSRPDLPTTEIGGRTVYTSQPLQTAIEEKFAEENPELYARLKQQVDQRMNPNSGTGSALTPMQPRAGAGSESDVYISTRDRIAADRPQYPEGYAPAGVGFQDSLRRSTAAIPFVGDKVSSVFGGPITYDNPTSFGGSGSLVTTRPSKANSEFFASANKGSNSNNIIDKISSFLARN